MAKTNIEWTRGDDGTAGVTWNPTTGCDRISPGCDNCYALTMAKRLKGMGQAKYQNDGDPRTSGPGFGLTVHPDVLAEPLRWTKPRRVFVNSMSDLFHARVPAAFIVQVWRTMQATPQHTYQVLTKRPERLARVLGHVHQALNLREPLPNVWLGTSIEDQKYADLRVSALLDAPAAVRFLSAEPLLGPVNLRNWIDPHTANTDCDKCGDERFADEIGVGHDRYVYDDTGANVIGEQWCDGPSNGTLPRRIDWLILGGESGPGARPLDPDWVRSLIGQCREAGAAPFVKQLGSVWARANGSASKKGGDPADWPADLRVREYPSLKPAAA